MSSVEAQCTPLDSFSENFDAYSCCAMGVVPTCWNSITTQGGNQIISNTSPASGTSNVYQFGYGSGKISIVILPELSNINAGTHRFRFKARVNSGPGLLQFGYITDINDAATFVVLENINITNSAYDSSSERTFTVPTSVPANARLAIRNPGTTWAGHYWDDAVWEPIPNLGTKETDLTSEKIYPNPFHDVLNISDVKDVKTVLVSDVVGRVIRTIEKPETKLHLGDLGSGVYFITMQYKGGASKVFKAIKK